MSIGVKISSSKEAFIVFITKGTEKQSIIAAFKVILCYSED